MTAHYILVIGLAQRNTVHKEAMPAWTNWVRDPGYNRKTKNRKTVTSSAWNARGSQVDKEIWEEHLIAKRLHSMLHLMPHFCTTRIQEGRISPVTLCMQRTWMRAINGVLCAQDERSSHHLFAESSFPTWTPKHAGKSTNLASTSVDTRPGTIFKISKPKLTNWKLKRKKKQLGRGISSSLSPKAKRMEARGQQIRATSLPACRWWTQASPPMCYIKHRTSKNESSRDAD